MREDFHNKRKPEDVEIHTAEKTHICDQCGKSFTQRRNLDEHKIHTLEKLYTCGHIGLNSTLHMIGKHPTGLCDWCGVRETVEHVLIQCNGYTEERSKPTDELQNNGEQHLTLKEILNPGGESLLIQCLKRTWLIHLHI